MGHPPKPLRMWQALVKENERLQSLFRIEHVHRPRLWRPHCSMKSYCCALQPFSLRFLKSCQYGQSHDCIERGLPHGCTSGDSWRSKQITSPPLSNTDLAISSPIAPPPPVTVSWWSDTSLSKLNKTWMFEMNMLRIWQKSNAFGRLRWTRCWATRTGQHNSLKIVRRSSLNKSFVFMLGEPRRAFVSRSRISLSGMSRWYLGYTKLWQDCMTNPRPRSNKDYLKISTKRYLRLEFLQ